MTTLIDQSARRHLVQSTQTIDLVSMIPVLTHPKADLEFPPNCGRDALNAALALTNIR
jgi:hypothetical protein